MHQETDNKVMGKTKDVGNITCQNIP